MRRFYEFLVLVFIAVVTPSLMALADSGKPSSFEIAVRLNHLPESIINEFFEAAIRELKLEQVHLPRMRYGPFFLHSISFKNATISGLATGGDLDSHNIQLEFYDQQEISIRFNFPNAVLESDTTVFHHLTGHKTPFGVHAKGIEGQFFVKLKIRDGVPQFEPVELTDFKLKKLSITGRRSTRFNRHLSRDIRRIINTHATEFAGDEIVNQVFEAFNRSLERSFRWISEAAMSVIPREVRPSISLKEFQPLDSRSADFIWSLSIPGCGGSGCTVSRRGKGLEKSNLEFQLPIESLTEFSGLLSKKEISDVLPFPEIEGRKWGVSYRASVRLRNRLSVVAPPGTENELEITLPVAIDFVKPQRSSIARIRGKGIEANINMTLELDTEGPNKPVRVKSVSVDDLQGSVGIGALRIPIKVIRKTLNRAINSRISLINRELHQPSIKMGPVGKASISRLRVDGNSISCALLLESAARKN